MPRKKQPADLQAAKGAHLSKDELKARKAAELRIPDDLRKVEPPAFIADEPGLCARFREYADMISKVMPDNFSQLDADALGDYVAFRAEYEDAMRAMRVAESAKEERTWILIASKAFENARKAAASLCLYLADRGKLAVPPPADGDGGAFDI